MDKKRLLAIYSPAFAELQSAFYRLEHPYGFKEIFQFNRIYERVYADLRKEEKNRPKYLSMN